MLKKRRRGVVLAFVISGILLLSGFAAALNESINDGSKSVQTSEAYACLESLVGDKSAEDLALSEAVFAMLALGNKANLIETIESAEGDNCWPAGNCRLKETGQVLLAYERIGKNSREIENWVSSKNSSARGLDWILQIDIDNQLESSCTISYNDQDRKINIGDDGKVSGNPGSCLDISNSGYWLKVKDGCLDTKFDISCEEDFITSILYQKSSGGTIYVRSEADSAAGLGSITKKVTGKCLGNSAGCDYEGTLWGALGLHKSGAKVSDYIPYLTAFADENSRFFPSAFLYILTGDDEYYGDIVQRQKQNEYWQIAGSTNSRFYDTSLAALALSGTSSQEFRDTQSYLMSITTEKGCWNNNNIRDTGFILYSAFGRGSVSGVSGASGLTTCSEGGFSCSTVLACENAGGGILSEFDCSAEGFGKVCCDVAVEEPSCSSLNGLICGTGESCTGSSVSSLEGSCCLGSCETVPVSANACENAGGYCAFSCASGDSKSTESCGTDSSRICCLISEEGGSNIVLIVLLVVLILLVVLGIIFRNKIRLWIHKKRGRFKTKPIMRPRGPPAAPAYRSVGQPAGRRVIFRKKASPKDKEFEETLRKLKDIGK